MNRVARDAVAMHRLLADEGDVVGKRHRRRPDVPAARHGVIRLVPSLVGQAVTQFRIQPLARTDFDAALGTHEVEDLIDDRAGKADAFDDLTGRQHAGRQEVLAQKVGEERQRQSRLRNRGRTWREPGEPEDLRGNFGCRG